MDADFVLVVEKDAVFQRLLEERIFTKQEFSRMVMVTGKGVPFLYRKESLYAASFSFNSISSYLCLKAICVNKT